MISKYEKTLKKLKKSKTEKLIFVPDENTN